MQDKIYDVIVIGGGMAAAHAAWPLVEAGKEVLMLDGGTQSAVPSYDATRKDFESIRRTDEEQYRLFLGEEPAGVIAASRISHSSTTTSGNRSYISARTDTFLPLDLHGVQITQSLAKGGLSEAWGAVCAIFNERELEHAGIPAGVMHAHYQAVIDRIGISGVEPGYQTQPPAHITAAMRQVLARYEKLSPERRGDFKLHTSLLALLTEPLGEREPTSYQDLDFYMTRESAIYRARYTIEELERRENFHYLPGHIVQRVGGKENLHEVAAKDFSGKDAVFRARRVVLAAGAVNSNRILFQSDSSLPPAEFFLKPNYTLACFDPRLLGEADERERYSLCQLTLELPDASGADVIHANLYNYRSLLLWRLLQHAPLPVPEALSLLARFSSALVLVDARFPGSEGRCEISLGERGLTIRAQKEGTAYRRQLPKLKRFLRSLGIIALHTAHPPLGSSIHCAGGISAEPDGQVVGHPGLYAADSSAWRALPAKSSALTIMANADRIGTEVLQSF